MSTQNTEKQNFLNSKICLFSIIVNILLAIIQFLTGFFSNSIAIITDAFDSIRDILATLIIFLSLHISKKPADSKHPFGHGRVEDIAGLVVSVLLILIGIGFFKDSILRFFLPKRINLSDYIIRIIFVVAIIKLLLGILTYRISLRTASSILKLDAIHHYSDSFTTFVVAVGLIFVKRGNFYVDSVLGIIISIIILVWSSKMAKDFIDNLIGKRQSESLYESIKKIALSFKLVEGIHDIEVHTYGKNRVILLHIEMSASLSLEEAHSVADSIEKKILNENLGRCIVHVDLKGSCSAVEKNKVEKIIKKIIKDIHSIKDFHGIEIITKEDTSILNFHLLLDKNTSLVESHNISHRISSILKKEFNFSQVNIHIEPY